MDNNRNVANITLNSSTDFVLQPANAASCKRSTIISDFAICNIALYNPLFPVEPYFKVICKLARAYNGLWP